MHLCDPRAPARIFARLRFDPLTPYLVTMKRLLPFLLLLGAAGGSLVVLSGEASAQQRAAAPAAQAPAGPRALGSFQDWTAATHTEAGKKVCYAFTRASKTEGGGSRQNVILTVTHRQQGRDQVALRAGYTYARNAEVELKIGAAEFPFYTAQDNAFAREGVKVVAAFKNGAAVVASGPGPQGRGTAVDNFSLSGFSAAYDAINRECPPPGRR
jgi:invasion protein IalB